MEKNETKSKELADILLMLFSKMDVGITIDKRNTDPDFDDIKALKNRLKYMKYVAKNNGALDCVFVSDADSDFECSLLDKNNVPYVLSEVDDDSRRIIYPTAYRNDVYKTIDYLCQKNLTGNPEIKITGLKYEHLERFIHRSCEFGLMNYQFMLDTDSDDTYTIMCAKSDQSKLVNIMNSIDCDFSGKFSDGLRANIDIKKEEIQKVMTAKTMGEEFYVVEASAPNCYYMKCSSESVEVYKVVNETEKNVSASFVEDKDFNDQFNRHLLSFYNPIMLTNDEFENSNKNDLEKIIKKKMNKFTKIPSTALIESDTIAKLSEYTEKMYNYKRKDKRYEPMKVEEWEYPGLAEEFGLDSNDDLLQLKDINMTEAVYIQRLLFERGVNSKIKYETTKYKRGEEGKELERTMTNLVYEKQFVRKLEDAIKEAAYMLSASSKETIINSTRSAVIAHSASASQLYYGQGYSIIDGGYKDRYVKIEGEKAEISFSAYDTVTYNLNDKEFPEEYNRIINRMSDNIIVVTAAELENGNDSKRLDEQRNELSALSKYHRDYKTAIDKIMDVDLEDPNFALAIAQKKNPDISQWKVEEVSKEEMQLYLHTLNEIIATATKEAEAFNLRQSGIEERDGRIYE